MSYTPSTDFDFTFAASYTPANAFDFTPPEGITYDLFLNQDWSLTAPTIEVGGLDQDWALTGVTIAENALNQEWSLLIYAYGDLTLDQSWTLSGPTFRDVFSNHAWALSAPIFRNTALDQSWALAVPTFADTGLDQQWALQVPTFTDTVLVQDWALVAPQGGDIGLAQQWRLEATAVWTKVISSTAYLLSLEQGEDRTEIPMANFSGQFRSGEPSYIQCSIPNAWEWADTVAAYAAQEDTEIVINAGYRWSDDSYTTQEIARVTLRNVRYDYGPRSATVSLDGIDTRTNPAPKAITLTGESYLNQDSDGRLRYRVTPQFDVRPGDTVTVGNDTFVVGELSYQVNASGASMEVAELIESV